MKKTCEHCHQLFNPPSGKGRYCMDCKYEVKLEQIRQYAREKKQRILHLKPIIIPLEQQTKLCEQCHQLFQRPPQTSNSKWFNRRYCSITCIALRRKQQSRAWKAKHILVVVSPRLFKTGLKEVVCKECGKSAVRFQYFTFKNPQYCSKECFRIHLKATQAQFLDRQRKARSFIRNGKAKPTDFLSIHR